MFGKMKEGKLTAYVLNELSRRERRKIEKSAQNDSALINELETLNKVCRKVHAEMQEVPLPVLSDFRRNIIKNRLVLEPVKEGYSLKYLLEWKVLAPALCASVLALVVVFKTPVGTVFIGNTNEAEQFVAETDAYAPVEQYVVRDGGDRGLPGAGSTYLMDKMVPGYPMQMPKGNYVGNGLFNGNLNVDGRRFNRSRSMKLINNGVVGKVAPSMPYNLDNYDIIFKNRTRKITGNTSYVVPVNLETGSYDKVMNSLNGNRIPPKDNVKIEEMVNYFDYDYPSSNDGAPFSVVTEISKSPWNDKHKLLHIGLKGKDILGETGLVRELVAKDVKIKLEFNPRKIKAYRLIGYESRRSANDNSYHSCEMFANELMSGHMTTVLYELIPVAHAEKQVSGKLMTLKFGYKLPDKGQWRILLYPVLEKYANFDMTSDNFRFSTAVAAFGMLLKNTDYGRNLSFDDVIKIAKGAKGKDLNGDRNEFVRLVETASALHGNGYR